MEILPALHVCEEAALEKAATMTTLNCDRCGETLAGEKNIFCLGPDFSEELGVARKRVSDYCHIRCMTDEERKKYPNTPEEP